MGEKEVRSLEPIKPTEASAQYRDDRAKLELAVSAEDSPEQEHYDALLHNVQKIFPNHNVQFGHPFKVRNVSFILSHPPKFEEGEKGFWTATPEDHQKGEGLIFFTIPTNQDLQRFALGRDGMLYSVVDGVVKTLGNPEKAEEARLVFEDVVMQLLGQKVLTHELITKQEESNPGTAYLKANPDYDFGRSTHGEVVLIEDLFIESKHKLKSGAHVTTRIQHPMTRRLLRRIENYETSFASEADSTEKRSKFMQKFFEPIAKEDHELIRVLCQRTMGVTIPDEIFAKPLWEVNSFLKYATGDVHASIQPGSYETAQGKKKIAAERAANAVAPKLEVVGHRVSIKIDGFELDSVQQMLEGNGKHHGLNDRWWEQFAEGDYEDKNMILEIDMGRNNGGYGLAADNYGDAVIETGALRNDLFGKYLQAVDNPDMIEMGRVFSHIDIIATWHTASAAELFVATLGKHHPSVSLYGPTRRTRGKYTGYAPIEIGDAYTVFYSQKIAQLDLEGVGEDVDYVVPPLDGEREDEYYKRVRHEIHLPRWSDSPETTIERYRQDIPPLFYRAFEERFDADVTYKWALENCPNLFTQVGHEIVFSPQFKQLLDTSNVFWRDLEKREFFQLTKPDLELLNLVISEIPKDAVQREDYQDPKADVYFEPVYAEGDEASEQDTPTESPKTHRDLPQRIILGYTSGLAKDPNKKFDHVLDFLTDLAREKYPAAQE